MSGEKAICASQTIDHMISTGGTIESAIDALVQAGGSGHIVVAATHAVFTPVAPTLAAAI